MEPPPQLSSNRMTRGHGVGDGPEAPSNNLWVGNLSADTNDGDLMDLFIKYGALDSVRTYSSRNFAFVYFKRVEDAKAAKDALQGTSFRGNALKIEFARPVKPCKHLWVGGISATVSKEELKEEFIKFGKIEDFKLLRDRNTAFIEYFRLEDASQAMKNMNGKQIGGEQIRVDFLRSQPSRRDQWPNSHDPRDGQFLGRGTGFSDIHSAYKRLHPQSSAAGKGDSQPSKILWIGYPPSVQVDEQMLHNAMILFGEIERIRSFPSRHYSLVEFRSVDEARRAKEGLQGRLFNDPRITIMFSSSDLALGKDYPDSYLGVIGPRPDFHGMQSGGVYGPNMTMRSFGGHGILEPDFHVMQETNPKSLESNWTRLSPSPGMCSSPMPGIWPMRHASSSWEVSDANQFQRDPKRSRIDNSLSIDDAAFPSRRIDGRGLGFEQPYGLGPITGGRVSSALINVQGRSRHSPVGAKVIATGNDCIWRGIIAKGGTPVCYARCISIEKGIGSELPEVVNCSARTGLDMLAKHYAEAIGFEIVFFLPDSEDDFASYTEFLRYLGSKNRAGVAKFDDGTTLFLVPPSDFLANVLNVVGPERLYGVVLKLPQQSMHLSETVERQNIPSLHAEQTMTRLKEEQVLPLDYGRSSRDDPKVPLKPQFLHASESQLVQPSSLDYGSSNTASISQAGVSLTPELIATLASLVPGAAESAESALPTRVSSTIKPLPPEHAGHSFEQLGNQFIQTRSSQIHNYPSLSSYSAQTPLGSSQNQELTVSTPKPGAVSSMPLTNFTVAPQSAHIAVSPAVCQQNQFQVPPSTQKSYEMVHGTDASTLYGSSVFQQPNNSTGASNLVNLSQTQSIMSLPADKVNSEYPNQMQQLQSVVSGTGQGVSEDEVDKNQRYQSTLQFAASLLLQIQNQQKQQHENTTAGQRTGNQL